MTKDNRILFSKEDRKRKFWPMYGPAVSYEFWMSGNTFRWINVQWTPDHRI